MEPCTSRNCRAEQEAAACATPVPEKVGKAKKMRRFFKQVFSRKSAGTSNAAEQGQCRDVVAGAAAAAVAAGVSPGLEKNPDPVKKKNKFKRFCKWAFSRKKKSTTRAQQNNKAPQSTSMYSCVSCLTAAVQEANEDTPEAEQQSDTTSVCSWHSCVSFLAANKDTPRSPRSPMSEENNAVSSSDNIFWNAWTETIHLDLKGKT
ncbi:hypothetical protein M9458_017922, partial [Cirrhinus mrigala]